MTRMKRHTLQNFLKKSRKIAAALAVFALTLSVALPLRAADDHSDRAIMQRVAPTYPELAKRMRVSGVVRVSATVAPVGSASATQDRQQQSHAIRSGGGRRAHVEIRNRAGRIRHRSRYQFRARSARLR